MKNVEAIKYLDNMEQGGFLTIKVPISRNQYIPVTAMFVGKDKDGRYEFLDTGESETMAIKRTIYSYIYNQKRLGSLYYNIFDAEMEIEDRLNNQENDEILSGLEVDLLELSIDESFILFNNKIDDFFTTQEERDEQKLENVEKIAVYSISNFPNHLYQVKENEEMEDFVENVKEKGVIHPVIVRPKKDGTYEMISGHRRKRACELAGIKEIPAIVREMTDEDAIIYYVRATTIEFKVENTTEIQKVEMIDKIVKIVKTDLATGDEKVLYIDIQGKSVEEMASIYNFNNRQLEQVVTLIWE